MIGLASEAAGFGIPLVSCAYAGMTVFFYQSPVRQKPAIGRE
jgi:hypothetical protein